MIQKIPISCTNQDDILIWRGIKNGIFSVRSAYRDSHGVLLSVRCGTRRGYLEPSLAEAEAVLMSIQLCHELGLSSVVFEGNAKGVVDGINSAEVDRGWMGQVMADIKHEIQALEDWKVKFIRRYTFLLSRRCSRI